MNWKQAFIHALEWRIISIVIDFCIVFALTGKFVLSLTISSVSALARTVGHAVWVKVKFKNIKGTFYK